MVCIRHKEIHFITGGQQIVLLVYQRYTLDMATSRELGQVLTKMQTSLYRYEGKCHLSSYYKHYTLYYHFLGSWSFCIKKKFTNIILRNTLQLNFLALIFQVKFQKKVFLREINIYETYHAGGVKNISAKDMQGNWVMVYKTHRLQNIEKSRIFSPSFNVNFINIYIFLFTFNGIHNGT